MAVEQRADSNGKRRPLPARFVFAWLGVVFALTAAALPAADWLLLDWSMTGSVHWVHEIWIRKLLAAKASEGRPRLLIVGGSSGHFGLDAGLLQERLGMPAVNLSTHAGQGLRFIVDTAEEAARPGDTILLYLEYPLYQWNTVPLDETARKMIWSYDTARVFRLPPVACLTEIYNNPLPDYLIGLRHRAFNFQSKWRPPAPWNGYSFVELSPEGDYTGETPVATEPIAPLKMGAIQGVRSDPGAVLKRFLAWSRERGISVIGAGPGMLQDPAATYEERRRAYGSIAQFYKDQGAPFVDAPEIFQLPRDFLSDTAYHPNPAGRRVITEALARRLAPLLHQSPPPADGPILLLSAKAPRVAAGEAMASKSAPSRCLLLTPQPLGHPLSITPAGVRQSAGKGKRFVYVDDEAGRMLAEVGLESTTIESKDDTLADWIALYPDHLFALAKTGGGSIEPMIDGVPEPFHSFLNRGDSSETALFGSGKLGHVQFVRTGETEARFECSDREPWQRGLVLPLTIELRSSTAFPIKSGAAPIRIGHCAIGGETGAGLCVAVIDPERGIVLRGGRFTQRSNRRWELRAVGNPAAAVPP